MSKLQPAGTFKRPSLAKAGSSSSPLDGMEQNVPSFQVFVGRTPPLDQQKPLPPAPTGYRRASSSSPPRSRTPSSINTRRSSSVYSRTASQWGPGDEFSWRYDEPLPPLPLLQPLAYSASTPHLVERQPTPPLLEPRTYKPPTLTPSPARSRVSTPSPPRHHEPSMLLPTPPIAVKVPQKHLHIVSLEKAKAAINAPGAVHLLPEEMRAQTSPRSKSHEPMRGFSLDIIAGRTPPELPDLPTLVDQQGRQRVIHSPKDGLTAITEYPFPTVQAETKISDAYLTKERTSDLDRTRLAQHLRKGSNDRIIRTHGIDEVDEQRGRTKHRAPRYVDNTLSPPSKDILPGDNAHGHQFDAQKMAQEYHNVLTKQYWQPPSSPAYHGTDSDESIKNHMKMVPKPLFQNKPPAQLPGSVRRYESERSVSPYHLSDYSRESDSSHKGSYSSGSGSFPPKLSMTPRSEHQRRSTSGSIPISPPTSTDAFSHATPEPAIKPGNPSTHQRPKAGNPRVSAYYPHVASRKGKKAKTKGKLSAVAAPPMPLLSADIIAQRLGRPETPPNLPGGVNKSSLHDHDNYRRRSDESSDKGGQTRHQRLAKAAAKYVDLLTKPSELSERRYSPPKSTATVTAGSPHLLPSPVKSKPPAIHLGWSDQAKVRFDEQVSPRLPPDKTSALPQGPIFNHIAAPARPLDESKAGLRDPETPRRKSSVFSNFIDGWKEIKAERRREELKKMIKVVPNTEENATQRRSSVFGLSWT